MEATRTRLLGVGHVDFSKSWRMSAQTHRHHELIVVLGGKIHVTIDGKVICGEAGDVLLYEAGRSHAEQADPIDGLETRYLVFDGAASPAALPTHLHDARGRIRQMSQWLEEEWSTQVGGGAELRSLLFRSILQEWLRLAHSQESPLVDRIRRYIRRHLATELDLARLAKIAGISKYHFIKVYKQLTGQTPMQEVRRLRVEHAQHLLLMTDLPLKAIAQRSGLGDEYQLCRHFRGFFNATPGQIRASIRR